MRPSLDTGYYATEDGHCLYWERHGPSHAAPVFFLHGGPGGYCSPQHLRFFDLEQWQVIVFDQRGCGRSHPRGETRNNSTAHSVVDIEALRRHLGLARINLLGVSWGSWLAVQYQQQFAEHVARCVLVSLFVPCAEHVAEHERMMNQRLGQLQAGWDMAAVLADLRQGNPQVRRRAALHWAQANASTLAAKALHAFVDDHAIDAMTLELHFHQQGYFFDEGQPIRLSADTLAIQGIHDRCGMASLRWLRQHGTLPARLLRAGHNALAPNLLQAVRQALDAPPPLLP